MANSKFNNKLKISSLNCKNVKTSMSDVKHLCDNSDICFLQETWLRDDELNLLNSINRNFIGRGTSAMNTDGGIISGRPFGGVAILWRKNLELNVNVKRFQDPRFIGIELTINKSTILLVNSYMPYECSDNKEDFIFYLGMLQDLVESSSCDKIAIIGDWNANIGSLFGGLMSDFATSNSMLISDVTLLPSDSYTYISEAHNSTSWLDHCVSSSAFHKLINFCDIGYDYVISDHRPIRLFLDLSILRSEAEQKVENPINTVHWEKVTDDEKRNYTIKSRQLLSQITIPSHLYECKNCTNSDHLAEIDIYLHSIIEALKNASSELCSSDCSKEHEYCHIPGWNDHVKDLYAASRDAFLTWRSLGSPKTGFSADFMRRCRARFKYALRLCKRNEDQMRADSHGNFLAQKSYVEFWRGIQKENCKQFTSPLNVGGETGTENIANLWKDHFSGTLNSVHNESDKEHVLNELSRDDVSLRISALDVAKSISNMKNGKSCAVDGISAEHLKLADASVTVHLSLCFSFMLSHNYVPSTLSDVIIIPIPKDKLGDLSDVNNYRPIAIASILSKVFENCILIHCADYLETFDSQFGFKKNHSTDQCIFVLKETIHYFVDNGSPVFAAFLDASKAFDRVNHWSLMKKLIHRGVPLCVVRTLLFWYRNQEFLACWNGVKSNKFHVLNGVRQGSILSPFLFAVYMDALSSKLEKSDAGCFLHGMIVNHLMYADDLVILAPSLKGLQKLLDVCCDFAVEHDIIFNIRKSHGMKFLPKDFQDIAFDQPRLNNDYLDYVDEFCYLGHLITSDLSDENDMSRQQKKMCARANVIIRKFVKCCEDVKKTLFRSFIACIYGCSLWLNYRCSSFNSIKVTYNKALRMMFNLPRKCSVSENFVQRDLPTFDELIRKQSVSLLLRACDSKNLLVSTLSSCQFTSRRLQFWSEKLFV